MKDVFDCSGFKKSLFDDETRTRFRADGLSIWVNKIPIPIDLFNDFFDSWRELFRLYLDHVMSSLILTQALDNSIHSGLSIKSLPSESYSTEHEIELKGLLIGELSKCDIYSELANEISSVLGVNDYCIEVSRLMTSLSHNGKKYERLYLPTYLRGAINKVCPSTLELVATRNGDMFGNIIADNIGLYRGGFGDALSILFNKLLDYKVKNCSGFIGKTNSVTLSFSKDASSEVDQKVLVQRISDGSLWEPFFDGVLKIRLNPSHPYYDEISKSDYPEVVIELLMKMAEAEMNSENTRELKILEGIRIGISRALWQKEY